jgi:putative alpha-1,2-mannosidase
VAVSGGSDEERLLFHTALYRALGHPATISDSRYPGFDGRVHSVPFGRRQYTAIPGWDAHRTHVQLLATLRPDVASDVVRSLQRAAAQAGWPPLAAAPVVASAYAVGARDFDLDAVPGQLVHQAETPRPPRSGRFEPRPGSADHLRLGFVPNVDPERGVPQPHGGSSALGYAVDGAAPPPGCRYARPAPGPRGPRHHGRRRSRPGNRRG